MDQGHHFHPYLNHCHWRGPNWWDQQHTDPNSSTEEKISDVFDKKAVNSFGNTYWLVTSVTTFITQCFFISPNVQTMCGKQMWLHKKILATGFFPYPGDGAYSGVKFESHWLVRCYEIIEPIQCTGKFVSRWLWGQFLQAKYRCDVFFSLFLRKITPMNLFSELTSVLIVDWIFGTYHSCLRTAFSRVQPDLLGFFASHASNLAKLDSSSLSVLSSG